ncbi:MAG: AmmeMemoRadiSam system protein B [Anaerolineae bacterium]|nr:AmmeMemoRadiSam system protein B [Anaerolineae bacterium]
MSLPKLRAIDVRPFTQDGQAYLLLRDPLGLSDRMVSIPRQLGPLLALCDGTRDSAALRAALAVRFGLRVGLDVIERLLTALDEALLLDNERFAQARVEALSAYRRAPYRPPASAGLSYPADAEELRRLLQSYLDAVEDPQEECETLRGLISPHIDYARGGAVYASVWKHAAASVRAAELVVVLGTDHAGSRGVTLTRQHYATPFGVLPTAVDVVDALAEAIGPEMAFADELHHRGEHSIELATVWLHYLRQEQPCPLVPILCGSFGHFVQGEANPAQDATIEAIVATLARMTAGRRVLVVAAADLAHVGPAFGGPPVDLVGRARLQAADERLIERICAGDAAGFFELIQRDGDRNNICGLPPIYLTLRLLGPVQGKVVAYARCPADEQGTSWVTIGGILLSGDSHSPQ